MHKKREKKKGYQRNEWNALTCMLSIFPFVYLSVRFFLAEMIIRQRISQWLWHKKFYFWLQKWSSDLKRPYDPKMWTSHIISCQHLVRSNCHRGIVTTLNYHLWELYVVRLKQCLRARAETKYEIAQTLVFSSFKLPIMVLSVEKRRRARMSWHGELLINCGSFRVIILAASTLF